VIYERTISKPGVAHYSNRPRVHLYPSVSKGKTYNLSFNGSEFYNVIQVNCPILKEEDAGDYVGESVL
jgi:hypothetical protein